jgi:site-specific recombinase XerC
LLRHSAAVALLNGGLGLDGIAAVLRHASSDTTCLYAKVDKRLLSTVVAPWPRQHARRHHQQDLVDADLRNVAVAWPSSTERA